MIIPLPISLKLLLVIYAGARSGSHPPRQEEEEKNSQDVNMDAVESKGAEATEKEGNGKEGGEDRVEKESELEPMDTQQQHSPKAQITADKVGYRGPSTQHRQG